MTQESPRRRVFVRRHRPAVVKSTPWLIAVMVATWIMGLAGPAAQAQGGSLEQRQPSLAYNAVQDEYLLVWSEDRGAGPDLFAKSLFANGLPKGGAQTRGTQVVTDLDGDGLPRPHGPRINPAMVFSADTQEYFLVWSEQAGEPDGFEVYGLRVGLSGKARSAPRLLAGGPGDQGNPTVAYLASRQIYLVAFDDNAADVDRIGGVRVRQNGVVVGPAFDLVRTAFDAQNPTIQARSDGFQLAWVDARNGNRDLFGRLLNDNGLAVGGARGMDTVLRSSPEDELAPALEPYLGQLVYNQYDPGTGLDVLGFQIETNGQVLRRNIGIVVPVADQADPAVAQNTLRAESLVAYADNRSGQFDIYAVRLRAGLPRGADFPLVADGFLP